MTGQRFLRSRFRLSKRRFPVITAHVVKYYMHKSMCYIHIQLITNRAYTIYFELLTGHLKLKGTLIYALLEIESALSISDIPVP